MRRRGALLVRSARDVQHSRWIIPFSPHFVEDKDDDDDEKYFSEIERAPNTNK